MPRRESSERNELHLHDNISNSDIVFYFRTPTTAEFEGYNNLSIQRRGRKIKNKTPEARLKYGLRVLTGVREGDFERREGSGHVPISSEPGSRNYYPEWKSWLRSHAADLVMLLGMHVFDISGEIEEGDDDPVDEPVTEDAEGNLNETLQR